MFSFDNFIFDIFSNPDNPLVLNFFRFVSFLFDPIPFIILSLITCLILYKKFSQKEVLMFCVSIAVTFCVVWVLKYSIGIERPPQSFEFGPSFPSAHASLSTCYFLYILHLLKRDLNKFRKVLHYFFCIMMAISVGVSRVYLSVHWFSDILFGYVLGAIICFVVIKYKGFNLKI